RPACESIESGVFLPHEYIYPSFCYFIALIAGAVYKVTHHINDARLLISDHDFYLYIRYVFLAIASLSVVWVYLLSMKVTKNYLASLIAGLVICASFEFSYHSRWAVSDCIVIQFAILSALFLFLNISRRKKIIFSSLVVGIAAGTKYPGGIIVLNVLFFILSGIRSNKKNLKITVEELFLLLFFSLIGFVITTPGVIFENELLMNGLRKQGKIYSSGHWGNSVQPGFDHFSKSMVYTIFELFSKNSYISFLIFLLSIIGVTTVLMRKQWDLLSLFITLLIYVIFVSRFKVMIVRNLLYILPFFAVFAAIGFDYLTNSLQKYKLSNALKFILLILLFYSCSNVISGSYNIKNKSEINLASELENYIEQNKDKEFIFSSGVSSLLKTGVNNNVKPSERSYFVFLKNEISYRLYKSNIKNQFTKIIGVDDVNFDYYPNWCGADRIVIMEYDKVSDDMLHYALKGITRKVTFDAENLSTDSSGLLNEFAGDTLLNNKSVNFTSDFILSDELVNRSDEDAHSGKYSVKVDKSNPYGFVGKLKLKKGSYYKFSVWRKNPKHTGFLVVGENNFFNRAWYDYDTDDNGWELLYLDYLCENSNIKELPVYVWQQDTLSPVYFDDLTITSVEKPE
ncbi:MAG: hypothetical protein ABI840_05670, partial [bacterium]